MAKKKSIGPADRQDRSLSEFLSGSFTAKRFKKLGMVDVQHSLLSSTVFGEIVWKKSLGRPIHPLLRAGFTMEANSPFVDTDYDSPRGTTPPGMITPYFPVLSDASPDNDHWRVNVMITHLQAGAEVNIHARLNADVTWSVPTGSRLVAGFRYLAPADIRFKKGETPVHFTIEVKVKPYFRFDKFGVIKK